MAVWLGTLLFGLRARKFKPFLGMGIALATYALKNTAAFTVMGRLELTNVDTPELWAARERDFFAMAAIITRAQEGGWASERELLDLIATCWGMAHGVVDLWIGGPLAAPFDGSELSPTLQRLLSDLLDGLAQIFGERPACLGFALP